MGVFDAITGSVIMRYKVETDQAKAKIKELSGEQKKAAKEAAEALEKQGKAAESMASQYAKGAAVIAGAYVLARDGVKQMREESRLSAGAAGVDIDRLSDSWGGLKTRMDLLTLAQAGHQGAWKLTTGQLQIVTEGMRALEKKGFDSQQVFEKFTDVLKKGKTEGLDDFGLSIKSTGNQAEDLKVLMAALGREVSSVGGDFAQAGDDVVRATVKMEDGINRVRVMLGQATNAVIEFAGAAGRGLGELVFGRAPEDVGPGGRASAYAQAFQRRGGRIIGGTNAGNLTTGSKLTGFLGGGVSDSLGIGGSHYNLMASPTAADEAAGRALDAFKSQVNRAMSGRGPLATASPQDFAKLVVGLPEGWRAVDEELAKRVDAMQAKLVWRMASGIGPETKAAAAATKAKRGGGRGRGGGSSAPADDWLSGALTNAVGTAAEFGGYLGDVGAANQNAARQDEVAAQRWAATMEQNRRFAVEMAQTAEDAARTKKQTFLESTFGKLEEFDQYGAAFDTLKGAVASGFNAWITGAESVGTAVRRSIAQSLGGYAIEMAGMALVSAAHGIYHLTNPLTAAQGAGELAAAAKYTAAAIGLGALAKLASPAASGAPASGGSATGGRAGRNQDHRGAGDGGGPRSAGQSTVIVLGGDYSDDSRRVRERNAYAAFTRTSTVYQPPRGAAA